jgi:hypothetical protein
VADAGPLCVLQGGARRCRAVRRARVSVVNQAAAAAAPTYGEAEPASGPHRHKLAERPSSSAGPVLPRGTLLGHVTPFRRAKVERGGVRPGLRGLDVWLELRLR